MLTGAPIHDAVRISRAAKEHRRDLPVVWGGWHPSMFPKECQEELSVDVTVQGQGETTFTEVVERLAQGETLEGCLGCAYRTPGGAVRVNPPRSLQDLNTLRRHDYSLIDVERYFDLKGKPSTMPTLPRSWRDTSRGTSLPTDCCPISPPPTSLP